MSCKRFNLIIPAITLMVIIGPFASAAQTYDVAAFYWPSLHDASGQAHQDWCQGHQAFTVCDISDGRGDGVKKVVSGNP